VESMSSWEPAMALGGVAPIPWDVSLSAKAVELAW